ncbi:hypothetical protein ACFL2Q_06465 [Thermodesulfobacteriota bacterium]
MSSLKRWLATSILCLSLFGWVSYPGWHFEYYSDWAEKYAYPASFSSPCDPPWGFWYW